MLYSYNGREAEPLPYRIRLPDGTSRTDPSSFTDEEIALAGYTPVAQTKPIINTNVQQMYWSSESLVWIIKDRPTVNTDIQITEWTGTDWSIRDYTAEELEQRETAFWNASSLNRIQFEFMVEKLNLTPVIETAISQMPATTEEEINAKIMAKVLFRSGQEFHRKHPLFSQLAPAVGLTEQQLDEIWIQAKAV